MTAAQIEQDLAILAVRVLRAYNVTDTDILALFTNPNDPADADYEADMTRAHGVPISAVNVKAHMRRIVAH